MTSCAKDCILINMQTVNSREVHIDKQDLIKQVKELAEVLCELHGLLLRYGPSWYTGEMDDRLRKTLAEADSSLRLRMTG